MADLDERVRELEVFRASAETTFRYIADFMREQVEINNRLANARQTLWGYVVGFIGMLVGLVSLIWSLKK